MEESPEWGTLSPEEFAHLQKYLDYSSKKVQDVLRDFYGDGALSQHLQGEVGPGGGPGAARCPPPALPQPLCAPPLPVRGATGRAHGAQRRSAPSVPAGSGLVCVNDVSCYFSLLEGGRPEDKLEFTFKLYDKDGNGLLDSSEVERIITQMMRVAQYLDWDVTELNCISTYAKSRKEAGVSAARPSVRPAVRPSIHLSVHLSTRLSVRLSTCPSVHLSVCPSDCPSTRPSVRPCHPSRLSIHPVCPSIPSVHPSVCPSVCLSIQLSVRPSVCPSIRPSIRP
uniref:EF-hand domain-containing protein n=1 Tax=Anser cygnoides TaxID=8845 RepID=A0A8B9E8Q3_ANSCY